MSNNPILSIKKALTGNSFPTGLTHGEIAINTYDNKLYVGGQTAISSNCVDSVEFVATFPNPTRVTREHFDMIVPAFQAEGIRIAYMLYSGTLAGFNKIAPTFVEGNTTTPNTFRYYLEYFLGDGTYGWRKMARESGYADYIGLYPYMLSLDTEPLLVGFADTNIPNVDQTVIDALEYANQAHRIMKEVYPSSIITEYSFPNLPGYFLNRPGNDSADWSRNPWPAQPAEYESEKIRLAQRFKSRLSSPIAPSGPYIDYVDWSMFAAYAYYYESTMVEKPYLKTWRTGLSKYSSIFSIEAVNKKKPISCIFSPFAYVDENKVWLDAAAIDTLSSTTTVIWTDANIKDLLLKPIVDNGIRKFIYWMDWVPYYADNAKRTPTSTTSVSNNSWTRESSNLPVVGDNEIFFARKVMNDLIVDAGLGSALSITDTSWQGNLVRKTLAIQAGIQKTVKMVQMTKELLAGQNTNAYCSTAYNTKSINTAYTYDTSTKGYATQGDKWLTGGSEYTWIDGISSGGWIELNATQFTSTAITGNDNYLSVRDFGAVGDGKTDDTLSIQKALNTVASMTAFGSATADKFIFFPPGTYKISPSRTAGGATSACLYLGLTGSLSIVGQNATLSCTVSNSTIPHASHMLFLDGRGNNVAVDGLNFNGNNKSIYGMSVHETTVIHGSFVTVTNCKFQNLYTPSPAGYPNVLVECLPVGQRGVNGYGEATGIQLYGGWKNIIVDKCTIKDVSRDEGSGIFGGYGTCGITIQGGYYNSVSDYVGTISGTISNCYIENITSKEPPIYDPYVFGAPARTCTTTSTSRSTKNVDCDGIKFFGGYITGSDYINCRASIYGNHFVNCRGRDIKIQTDEVTIVNNTSSLSVLPIVDGGVRINCQITSGIVSNNVFHFDPVSTTGGLRSPFIEDGGPTAGGSIVSFYDGNADLRNRAITISNNTVYNNVPTSIGILAQFFDNTEGEFLNNAPSLFATIKGNKIVGKGACQRFANITGRQANSPYFPLYSTYYTFSDNMISNIAGGMGIGDLYGQNPAFLMGSGSFDRCYISMHGNVNAGGSSVRPFVSSSSTLYYQGANMNAYSNIGIGLTANDSPQQKNTQSAAIPRFDGMSDPLSVNGAGGVMTVQSYSLNPGDTYVFPKKGYYGYGKICMLNAGANWGAATQALFVQGGDRLIPISIGAYVTFGSPTSQTNLGLTGYMNVWVDDNDCINVQQKMLPYSDPPLPQNVPVSGGAYYGSVLRFDLFSFG
jgi:hypothetical protein